MDAVTGYRLAAAAARYTPETAARGAAAMAGLAAAMAGSERRLLVRRNLERALGRSLGRLEAHRRVASVFGWYARYYLESFKLPSLDAATVDAGFAYEGFTNIERAVQQGTGPILVMPHLGTWEWAAWWLAQVPKMKVTAVVEPIEPPEVFEWFTSLRTQLGMDIIPLGPDAGGRLAAAVRRGHVVCLLSDRDIGGTGVPVQFFGETTRLPTGPALLALRTGTPLIPAAVFWRDGGRHAIARPPLDTARRGSIRKDVARVAQDYATALEGLIREAPDQWHLMSPNWPSDYKALGKPVPESLRNLAPATRADQKPGTARR